MGWLIYDAAGSIHPEHYSAFARKTKDGPNIEIPHFSTDIVAALEASKQFDYFSVTKEQPRYAVTFNATDEVDAATGSGSVTVYDESLPLAICIATLKAKGVKVQE